MSLDLESRSNGAPVAQQPSMLASVSEKPVLDEVLREEAEFANRDYAPFADRLDMSPTMFRKYSTPSQVWDYRQIAALMLGDIDGKDFLDYGCGMGEESVYFAKLGARVTGIDISEVGVEMLRQRARHNQVVVRALEMRADPTSFADESFDKVHGMGILHHVGIDKALAEVKRLLRPGGVGVFLEPMGDVPAVEAAKEFLMTRLRGHVRDVTDHEHNLTWAEIEQATRRFSKSTTIPYHLLYRIKSFFPYAAHDVLRRIDVGLLSVFPQLRRFAGAVVIKVVK